MKKAILTLVIVLLSVGNIFSQINYEKYSLIGGLKTYNDIVLEGDTISVNSIEIGIGISGGKEFNSKYVSKKFFGSSWTDEVFANWVFATPYATIEYNTAYNVTKDKGYKFKNETNHVMLNVGGSIGGGFNLFYLLPVGVVVSSGLSSDFRDVYHSYSYGLCFKNLSINFGGRTNWTQNKSSNYKSLNYTEIKYTFNLFNDE